jgi:hypothetical protein
MAASPCIQCRIDPQLKLRLRAVAVQRGLTESAVLKRLVIAAVGMAPASDARVLAVEPIGPRARVYVRLRPGDHVLLRARAARRGLASATYVSMLVRAHLRGVSPASDPSRIRFPSASRPYRFRFHSDLCARYNQNGRRRLAVSERRRRLCTSLGAGDFTAVAPR